IAIVFMFLLSISGCTHKRLLNQGAELEQQGLYIDAFNAYYSALRTKNNMAEAKLGLQRTGRHRMENLLKKFSDAFDVANYQEAVYHYQEAKSLQDKAARYRVELSIPPYYDEYYQECKVAYLQDRYKKAVSLLEKDNFALAEQVLQEITAIDPEYKDVGDMLETAVYEPKYRRAKQLMNDEKYRSAYASLGGIIQNTGGYKNCNDLRQKAKEEATIDIGIAPFTSRDKDLKSVSRLQEKIADAISKTDNPFIRLVEYDDKTQVPDAIIKGDILDMQYYPGRLNKDDVPGWFRKSALRKEDISSWDYKKIKYQEYRQNSKLSISFSMKLVNTKNNELMISEQYDLSKRDNIHYASYSGDNNRLVPGYWKYRLIPNREDVIKDYPDDTEKLKALLHARETIKSRQELFNTLCETISEKTCRAVESYNPES
ncbi:MAG TPA: hypothetical protein VJ946_06555, partial [Bacteroidales bacterium]|nr:hypothetical protein [Bacteroidales bacterium]